MFFYRSLTNEFCALRNHYTRTPAEVIPFSIHIISACFICMFYFYVMLIQLIITLFMIINIFSSLTSLKWMFNNKLNFFVNEINAVLILRFTTLAFIAISLT